MTLIIRASGYYRNGLGEKRGPMRPNDDPFYSWTDGSSFYTDRGNVSLFQDSDGDLICEWVEPVQENPGALTHVVNSKGEVRRLGDGWPHGEFTHAYCDPDGWITWKGEECPVDWETLVDVRLGGPASHDIRRGTADTWNWTRDIAVHAVYAYRIVPQPAPEAVAANEPDATNADDLKGYFDACETINRMSLEMRDLRDENDKLKVALREIAGKAWEALS